MGYVLGQYNQKNVPNQEGTDVSKYITPLTEGIATRKKSASDNGVTGNALNPFWDECVKLKDTTFQAGSNYYFHAKIKRLKSIQVFYIYLVNYEAGGSQEERTQYLKTITVQGGDDNEWVDFEMIFNPLIQFDTILFQLQRSLDDYRTETRYPTIVYEELSLVNNALTQIIKSGVSLIKLGIQSHPGLMMCINGEEIHIGSTGTYELRNGIVTMDFFSVVKAGIEVEPIEGYQTFQDYLTKISQEEINPSEENGTREKNPDGSEKTSSKCIFGHKKKRGIDAYVLDYIYKED